MIYPLEGELEVNVSVDGETVPNVGVNVTVTPLTVGIGNTTLPGIAVPQTVLVTKPVTVIAVTKNSRNK